ncbi:PstS family phosphate ABC transporter substrate-binding protein [Halonotius pteroides]|uniref:Phosphate ABC transporter substrate-binding protein n=1 Tax=Halonotius pteroides TaxID=268735 RepID=A0A3A6QD32_9EURY|nr:substrate-binding domain-containing protein [Halonotius pteroides]RJX49094.1 phosphate ABC transporter substrate-binding protein [Halonotius pteroides]
MTQQYSRRSVLSAATVGTTISAAGCLGGGGGGGQTVRISGGVGPLPMVQVWADIYAEQSDLSFDISGGGTGVGVSDLFNEQVDVAMMGREPFQEELERGLVAVPMLIDTVVGTVNQNNPVIDQIQSQGVTRAELEAIFTKEITNWGELFPDAGVDAEIVVYGRSDASAAYKKWGEFLGGEGNAYTQDDLEGLSDGNFNGDQPVAQSLGDSENAIGMNNINYVYNLDSGELDGEIRPIPLDQNGDGLSESESFYQTRGELLAAVERGDYPAPPAREMWLAANGAFDAAVAPFIEWVLTDGQQYVSENGYVPLTEDRLEDGRTTLENNTES